MKQSTKIGLGVAGAVVLGVLGFATHKRKTDRQIEDAVGECKYWTRGKIREGISLYGQKDRQWTGERFEQFGEEFDKKLRGYDQENKKWVGQKIKESVEQYERKDRGWTRQRFEAKVNQDQLVTSFNSVYQVLHEAYYRRLPPPPRPEPEESKKHPFGGWAKTTNASNGGGELLYPPRRITGSGILLKGHYFLTAYHVVNDVRFQNEPTPRNIAYDHSEFSILHQAPPYKGTHNCKLEKIIINDSKGLDYALFKVNPEVKLPFYPYGVHLKLPFYHYGLNLPDQVKVGMRSIAVGFPLGLGRNMRLGNLSQLKSDTGPSFLTFKNSIIFGDSGGPIFVVDKEGNIKLGAMSDMVMISRRAGSVNIGYGVNIRNIVEDMEKQLKSGNLDEEKAKKVKDFLKLNK